MTNLDKAPFECLNQEPEEVKYWFVRSTIVEGWEGAETAFTNEADAVEEYANQLHDSSLYPYMIKDIQPPRLYTKAEILALCDQRTVTRVEVENAYGEVVEVWPIV